MVPSVISNGKYRSKSTGNLIQLPKLNSLFNLGQTQLRLIMYGFNIMKFKEINKIIIIGISGWGSPHYYVLPNKNYVKQTNPHK